ncbi:hypothetical protein WH221_08915 [Chryseobacterium culicis]|uniref:Lipoprotein n=1 Tax=Chryseobacterium culicis TaxID=680127 RepID=A0A2S9D0V4_CHRCI|nr:hypothetical protein [Chryseobacterium culicis]PRB86350.1 hypothetical protein CQ022_08905 [Chryseobacterium culicis]PRB92103.1 hypothetical protein CQ033_02575 [Chryseobacterium culicis]
MEKMNYYLALILLLFLLSSCRDENELDTMEPAKINSKEILKGSKNSPELYKIIKSDTISVPNNIDEEDPKNTPPKK